MSLIEQVKEINAEISEFNKSQQEALAYAKFAKESLKKGLDSLKENYGIELPDSDSPEFEEKLKETYTLIKNDLEKQVELSKKVLDLADAGEFGKARELLGISNNLESENDTVEVENTANLDDLEIQPTVEKISEVKSGKGTHHIIEDDGDFELKPVELERKPKNRVSLDSDLEEEQNDTSVKEEPLEEGMSFTRKRRSGIDEVIGIGSDSQADEEDFSIPTRRRRSSFATEPTKESDSSVTLDEITKAVKSEPKGDSGSSDAPIVRSRKKRTMDPDWFK